VDVRIVARSTLTRFIESLVGHREQRAVRAALDAWFHEAAQAEWSSSADVKERYANASILGAERVVFNIKGNDYRLVTAIDYRRKIVFIKWLGTHAGYDRIDARSVQYGR
jgi:mRNA interferase HigB